jgi:hypothetical protein
MELGGSAAALSRPARATSFGRHDESSGWRSSCAFDVDLATLHGRHTPTRRWKGPTDHGDGSSGNLEVAIPPVVFIREHGRQLDVTTNTGERPQSSDTFYVISPGKAQLAGATVRHEVLSACAPAPNRH